MKIGWGFFASEKCIKRHFLSESKTHGKICVPEIDRHCLYWVNCGLTVPDAQGESMECRVFGHLCCANVIADDRPDGY